MIHSCRTRADFDRLRREGVRRSGSRIWIRHVDDHTCIPPRVAFAMSRRNGSAPARNRLRRQIKALVRDEDLDLAPGIYLFGHRGRISQMSNSMLRSELEATLPPVGTRR